MVNTRTLEQLLHDDPGQRGQRRGVNNRRSVPVTVPQLGTEVSADQWDLLGAAETATDLRGAARKRARTCRTLAANADLQRDIAMLRTQILQVLRARDWHTVGITAPRRGAGATVTAAGLGASFARLKGTRCALLDFDLERPGLASAFELESPGPMSDWLGGQSTMESQLVKLGESLALGLARDGAEDSSVLLQPGVAEAVLRRVHEGLHTDLVLCDLPPLLESEAALALLPAMDAVLVVTDGHRNTGADLQRCEKMIEGRSALLGMVLNRSDGEGRT